MRATREKLSRHPLWRAATDSAGVLLDRSQGAIERRVWLRDDGRQGFHGVAGGVDHEGTRFRLADPSHVAAEQVC